MKSGECGASGALDLASLHAVRAHVGLVDMTALVLDRDLLYVRTEHAVRHSMRVADTAPRDGSLTANFTNLRHRSHSITFGSGLIENR